MTVEHIITIDKKTVLDEVKKSSAYIGSKLTTDKDPAAYSRVSLIEANDEQLERFWCEACSEAVASLSHWQTSAGDHSVGDNAGRSTPFTVTLALPSNWNDALGGNLDEAVAGYLTNQVLARWLMLTDRPDVEGHGALAAASLNQARRLVLERKRPDRRDRFPKIDGGIVVVADDRYWHDELEWRDDDAWLE